jgi:hypothetical protein
LYNVFIEGKVSKLIIKESLINFLRIGTSEAVVNIVMRLLFFKKTGEFLD